MWGQAEAWPPGMRLGPYLAPSSPPDTPEPTYRSPFFSNSLHLRVVSWCSEFPPSMIMSPLLNKGINFWMKSSTAWPALTISIILRGFLSFWTMSSSDLAPTTFKKLFAFFVIFLTVLHTRWRFIIKIGRILLQKSKWKFVKFCLHCSKKVRNSIHFDEIFLEIMNAILRELKNLFDMFLLLRTFVLLASFSRKFVTLSGVLL